MRSLETNRAPPVPPILHLMRHGQGYHALATNGQDLRDPHLTAEGQRQCRERRAAFDRMDHIELLCASPLRRALQTCAITFAPALARGLRIVAAPLAEEVSSAASDTGSDAAELVAEFGSEMVDLAALSAGWWRHEGAFGTDPPALIRRAAALRRWVRDRSEREIVLVAHGFFNHYLTGDVDEKGEQTTPWWGEAELRTFVFVDEGAEGARAWAGGPMRVDGEDVAMIRETDESLARRGKAREHSPRQNVNRPAEREFGLLNFQLDRMPDEGARDTKD